MNLRAPCEHGRYEDCDQLLLTYGTKRPAARCPGGDEPTAEDLVAGLETLGWRSVSNEYISLPDDAPNIEIPDFVNRNSMGW